MTDRPGEDALIARFFAPLARHPGALALTDDAAVITPPAGRDLVLTKDALVAGVHFFADDPPDAIARKALRVNLSDLAAKGAEPLGFLLAIALHDGWTADWLAAFARGLNDDSQAYGIALLGGDTVRAAGPLVVSVTAFGSVPKGGMVRRAGAKPGDWVVVSGTIGDAALGLRLRQTPNAPPFAALSAEDRATLADRYLLPRPRNALAGAVCAYASAAMDVSDGLAGDLAKLCKVSGVSARVETALLPLSKAATKALDRAPDLMVPILTGGDDYEILATVPPDRLDPFIEAAKRAGVPVAAIGEITEAGAPLVIYGTDGAPIHLAQASFSHF